MSKRRGVKRKADVPDEEADLIQELDMQAEAVEKMPRDMYGAYDCRRSLVLKPDHANRPLYVTPDCHVFLETFSPIYKQAYDFVIAIAEPLSRPQHIHEYKLTHHSLYAAISIGLKTDKILDALGLFCKTEVPREAVTFIEDFTATYGKVRLILKANKYFIESSDATALHVLLQDPIIAEARRAAGGTDIVETAASSGKDLAIGGTTAKDAAEAREDALLVSAVTAIEQKMDIPADLHDYLALVDGDNEDVSTAKVVTFEVPAAMVQAVQKQCTDLEYPLLAEYDFRHDSTIPTMAIDLKPTCVLRSYQVIIA